MRRISRLPDLAEFFWGQASAVGVAILFMMIERVRLSWPEAAIEAFRIWGFMAASVLSIWLALQNADPVLRIAIGILAPIVAALIFNNVHRGMRRRLERAE
jgi:hypothetical protein